MSSSARLVPVFALLLMICSCSQKDARPQNSGEASSMTVNGNHDDTNKEAKKEESVDVFRYRPGDLLVVERGVKIFHVYRLITHVRIRPVEMTSRGIEVIEGISTKDKDAIIPQGVSPRLALLSTEYHIQVERLPGQFDNLADAKQAASLEAPRGSKIHELSTSESRYFSKYAFARVD